MTIIASYDEQVGGVIAAGRSRAGVLNDRPLTGYGLAVASVAAALLLRLALDSLFPPGLPFLILIPPIIITAYLAGLGPAILAAVLGLFLAKYFLVPPLYSLVVTADWILPLSVFALVSALLICVIHIMQQALQRLESERAITARLYDQQRTMFQELQHRTANNMAFVSAMLRLQKRKIADAPESAAGAFDEAVARLDLMSKVHRRLYDPGAANRALQDHLQLMCDEVLLATGASNVCCQVELPALYFDLERLLPLSLLVAEVVTNSLKHGLAGKADGLIRVTLEGEAGSQRAIVIRDNGAGLPDGYDISQSKGLGMRIIQGLAAQVGGRLTMGSEGGAVTRLYLDA